MLSEKKYLWDNRYKNDYTLFQFLGSWSNHYKSWLQNKNFKIFFIKYEDLEKNTQTVLFEMIEFINSLKNDKSEINKNKILNCIQSTKFNLLKKKEKESGFPENVGYDQKKKIDFFNLGPNNLWNNILPSNILLKANETFKEDLKYLNY